MAGFIFKNKSYLITYNFKDEELDLMHDMTKEFHFKILNEGEFEEFKDTVERVHHYVGLFINIEKMEGDKLTQMLEFCDSTKIPYFLFDREDRKLDDIYKFNLYTQERTQDYLRGCVKKQINRLIPPGLGKIAQASANYILPFLFNDFNTKFYSSEPEEGSTFDFVVTCETISEDFAGKCTIKVNTQKLIEESEEYKEKTKDSIIDATRELANQFLGVVNFNLLQMGILSRISLPLSLDLSSAKIHQTGPFIPVVNLCDLNNIFHISIGFISTNKSRLFNLTENSFVKPPQDVDFLSSKDK